MLCGGGEAERQVALGIAGLHQGANHQLAVGLGDPRRAHADRPRHLHDSLLREAGVVEGLHSPRRLHVGLGQGSFVGVRIGDAERRRGALHQVEVDAGDLGHLARRIAGAIAGQGPLDREQGEAPGGDRLAQLLHRDALGRQLLEQRKAGPAGLALDALQQALGVEVDRRALRHARHSAPQGPRVRPA